jgi:hypothetical protein
VATTSSHVQKLRAPLKTAGMRPTPRSYRGTNAGRWRPSKTHRPHPHRVLPSPPAKVLAEKRERERCAYYCYCKNTPCTACTCWARSECQWCLNVLECAPGISYLPSRTMLRSPSEGCLHALMAVRWPRLGIHLNSWPHLHTKTPSYCPYPCSGANFKSCSELVSGMRPTPALRCSPRSPSNLKQKKVLCQGKKIQSYRLKIQIDWAIRVLRVARCGGSVAGLGLRLG